MGTKLLILIPQKMGKGKDPRINRGIAKKSAASCPSLHISATSKKGDFMGRSEIRAMLCAGKIGIGSSIQAQKGGEVMSQNWRGYCLFDKYPFTIATFRC